MISTLLKSIYILFFLKTFVAMGLPTSIDKQSSSKENRIVGDTSVSDADASVKFYTCIYIPSMLENCNFPSHRKIMENIGQSENRRMGRRKRELLSDNKESTLHSSTSVSRTEEQFPELGTIIIYKIERCVPPRLPFDLPWCTEKDLVDKKRIVYRLIPFVRNSTGPSPLVLPDYDF